MRFTPYSYTPYQGQKLGGKIAGPLLILLLGVGLGVLSKWSDSHMAAWFAEITGGASLWILLGTVIALYSRTAGKAALNVLLFLGGMVAAYCLTAVLTNSVWGTGFLIGWGIAVLLSPLAGYLVWFAKGKSKWAWILSAGVLVVQMVLVIVLFRRVRISDIVMILLTAAVLLADKFGRR